MTHPLYVRTIDATNTVHPSIRAAARAHGVSRRTVAYHLDTYGDLSRLGRGKARPGCQNASKVTVIFGREFPSRVAAAKHLGISISQFNRWTRPDASAAMRDMLMAAMMRAEAGRVQA
ncbi:NUMOD1 domain-containing DNA-binding protein [Paracoccus sp. DMF-8]|uniref:NUMOD1 domain-containing DNA-binding protein n=1 Tax=Paracoccus sp. DMF-8 TaxID=3019445 RepID=UPI0023E39DBE|nr:NUMOD1 domain-containing DNA-binding protein [Paracoccus sp. DMF-8]MDF3607538.1 NUMOD1 domain-containing DNA-binding protein [Paracoccus sp. DMF-8]